MSHPNLPRQRARPKGARDLGLYVHFPWCVRKCPYCDFNSHPLRGNLEEDAYVKALLADFQLERRRDSSPISSVFFGGGTPSLFSPRAFATLIDEFGLAEDAEVTMEANPGTVEVAGSLEAYREAGINRISLGAQSFDASMLATLGRIHGARETVEAAASVVRAGFPQFNTDIMFGLPGQNDASACDDLKRAIDLAPTHISWYQLTIEPKTEFARRPPSLPSADAVADIADAGQALLRSHGYVRYEVSAYAQPGCEAQHNVNYWTFGDYLGIGAGAHGKITHDGAILRTAKAKQPRLYLKQTPEAATRIDSVDPDARPLEFMMNALRLVDGVEERVFEQRTHLPLSVIAEVLGELRSSHLMRDDRLALTPYGYDHLDDVLGRFV